MKKLSAIFFALCMFAALLPTNAMAAEPQVDQIKIAINTCGKLSNTQLTSIKSGKIAVI